MTVISVVRDFEMYDRCVGKNPHNAGAVLYPIDNRTESKGIPTRYNEFLNSYDYSKPDWFVFCHEDWEVQEDWQARLCELDKESLYGPVGVALKISGVTPVGQIVNSDKAEKRKYIVGRFARTGTLVDTFDCQCFLVHSDLIRKYDLRFDEKLSFDLYAEDFCVNAKERHGVNARIVQLKCQHYSFGNMQPRFYEGMKYLKRKYEGSSVVYASAADIRLFFGGTPRSRFRLRLICGLRRFLYTRKRTHKGNLVVKVCKIPVWHKKERGERTNEKLV